VWVGNNELDYVTPEVTVRYFTPTAVTLRVQARASQVHYISEDVTVRSVTPKHATVPPAQPAGNIALPVDQPRH